VVLGDRADEARACEYRDVDDEHSAVAEGRVVEVDDRARTDTLDRHVLAAHEAEALPRLAVGARDAVARDREGSGHGKLIAHRDGERRAKERPERADRGD